MRSVCFLSGITNGDSAQLFEMMNYVQDEEINTTRGCGACHKLALRGGRRVGIYNEIEQISSHFFCKGSGGKCFRPDGLCFNYSTLTCNAKAVKANAEMAVAVFQ